MIRLHYLQHEPFEGPAYLETSAHSRGWSVSGTMLHEGEKFPPLSALDLLLIMGGSMNVYEDEKYPWLQDEKRFIADAIASNKKIIGICLGAQLIADVLGARVVQNRYPEIGWFPIRIVGESASHPALKNLPQKITVFHWHGDTFAIPEGAVHFAESDGCAHQGFIYKDNVIAMQFHLESDRKTMRKMVIALNKLTATSPFVQPAEEIMTMGNRFMASAHRAMDSVLDNLYAK